MLKITSKEDCSKILHLPPMVQLKIEEIIAKLNFYYGENRNPDSEGGYVVVVESLEDYKILEKILYQSIESVIPEYVEKISLNNATFYNALILLSSDFSISIILNSQK